MQTILIKGDWLIDGMFDNLDRDRQLNVTLIEGRAYDDPAPWVGGPPLPITIDANDRLAAWGGGVAFLPDRGELDRVGRHIFFVAP